MILSNFNRYKSYEHENYQGLNMLHTVFNVMFLMYNTFLGNLLMDNKVLMYGLTGTIWIINWIAII